MDLQAQAAGIAALADATRSRLYEYVVAAAEPVGREQVARDLGLALHTASFHLDRLVTEGLLEVEYRRLSGRTGPGAGRPSKLYKRGQREFAVSLPPRQYDLVGDILAAAVTRVGAGEELAEALRQSAHEEGLAASAGRDQRSDSDAVEGFEPVAGVLRTQGFEPAVEGEELVLNNCPFDALAHKHTQLVCGLNVDYVQGVIDGVGSTNLRACLTPYPGRCCVTLQQK